MRSSLGRTAVIPVAAFIAAAALIGGCAPRAGGTAGRPRPPACSEARSLSAEIRGLNVESFEMIRDLVSERWYDPQFGGVDWDSVSALYGRKIVEASTMREVRVELSRYLGELGVSHMAVIPADYYDDSAGAPDESTGRAVTGIDLRVLDGRAVITSVVDSSPADSAGVRPGWEVVRVDSVIVSGQISRFEGYAISPLMKQVVYSWSVMELMMGLPGSSVEIAFIDGSGAERVMRLPLAEEEGIPFRFGHVPEFRVRFESREVADGIGYMRFNGFAHPPFLMSRFNGAMDDMMGFEGIIIDLRGNPGGVGEIVRGMAGWFIGEKGRSLGRLITRETTLELIVNPRPRTFGGRLAILVDGLSGSASEFMAGGLQGLGAARVFGTRTVGAALPSNIVLLPNGDRLQFVTADFVDPRGMHIEGNGVVPDTEVRLTRKALLEGRDPVIEAATDWIRGGE